MKDFALLFPGQGAQAPGMARDFADADPEIMDLWKQAESISGLPLRGLYWDSEDPAMVDTRNLQPGLTVANLSIWTFVSRHLKPVAAAGHSLGEYSALAASGALPFKDVMRAVTIRGQLMADADPAGNGAMAAVLKLPLPAVLEAAAEAQELVQELVIVANRNTPAQFVLSGTKNAVAQASELARQAGGKVIPLAVSGAFHSPLMAEAAREMRLVLQKLNWNQPAFPIYCNVNGQAVNDRLSLQDIMQEQITSPVLWVDTIENMSLSGINSWLELGPKAVVGKMAPSILEALQKKNESAGAAAPPAPEIAAVTTLAQASSKGHYRVIDKYYDDTDA